MKQNHFLWLHMDWLISWLFNPKVPVVRFIAYCTKMEGLGQQARESQGALLDSGGEHLTQRGLPPQEHTSSKQKHEQL